MLIKMKESKGFTLVELMIVVAIIGILAAVAVPYYQRYVAKSRLTSLVFPGIHAIENAISTKYAVQGELPASADATSADMVAWKGDADVTYIKADELVWTYANSQEGTLTVNLDTTNAKFSALGPNAGGLRCVAKASGGKMYWEFQGTLAKEFGLQ